jgi:hypothetical protein
MKNFNKNKSWFIYTVYLVNFMNSKIFRLQSYIRKHESADFGV